MEVVMYLIAGLIIVFGAIVGFWIYRENKREEIAMDDWANN